MNKTIYRHVKTSIIMVLVWLTVHQEKYTMQKLHDSKAMMISDFILDHFVLKHVPVSSNIISIHKFNK